MCFGLLSHQVSDLRILASAVYKTERDRALSIHAWCSSQALFPLHFFIGCTLSHWQPHHRKLQLLARIRFQNTSRGSSRPPTSNAAFLTPESNNAASERSHQTTLCSKCIWLCIIGMIWKEHQCDFGLHWRVYKWGIYFNNCVSWLFPQFLGQFFSNQLLFPLVK